MNYWKAGNSFTFMKFVLFVQLCQVMINSNSMINYSMEILKEQEINCMNILVAQIFISLFFAALVEFYNTWVGEQ